MWQGFYLDTAAFRMIEYPEWFYVYWYDHTKTINAAECSTKQGEINGYKKLCISCL